MEINCAAIENIMTKDKIVVISDCCIASWYHSIDSMWDTIAVTGSEEVKVFSSSSDKYEC